MDTEVVAVYRNNGFVETALKTLAPNTQFCIACDLTLPTEYIKTKTIKDWRQTKIPDLHKRPAIFILYVKNSIKTYRK